jgi:hypothetical protein
MTREVRSRPASPETLTKRNDGTRQRWAGKTGWLTLFWAHHPVWSHVPYYWCGNVCFYSNSFGPQYQPKKQRLFLKKRKENNCFIETGAQQGKACGCSGQDMHETYNVTASISGFRTCMGYLSLCSEE